MPLGEIIFVVRIKMSRKGRKEIGIWSTTDYPVFFTSFGAVLRNKYSRGNMESTGEGSDLPNI